MKRLRKLRKLFWSLLIMMFLLAGMLYYAYQNAFDVPAPMLAQIRRMVNESSNVDFDAESLRLNVKNHTLRAKNLKIMTPAAMPFAEINEAIIYFASGTGPLDLYHSRVLIEKIECKGFVFDPQKPLPAKNSRQGSLDNVPAREILIDGLQIKTPLMNIDAPGFAGRFLRSGKNGNIHIDLGEDFLGGTGRIIAIVDLAGGFTRARFAWKQDNFAGFMPLMLLSHLYGLTISSGSAEILLQYQGNLAERLENPGKDLHILLNQELKGYLGIKDCEFVWSGIKGILQLSALRDNDNPWACQMSLADGKGKISVDGIWKANERSLKDFSAKVTGENLALASDTFARLGITLANTEPGELDFAGDFKGEGLKVSGKGFAKARDWQYQKKLIKSADLNWNIDEDYQLQTSGKLDTEIGDLIASAGITIGGPGKWKGKVEGVLQRIDLQSLRPFIESPVAGKCSGPFKVLFDLKQPASTSYEIYLEMHDGSFYGFTPETFTARIFGVGSSWNLANPIAIFPNSGAILLDGLINSRAISGKVKVDRVDLRNFDVSEDKVAGFASLDAKIEGPLSRPTLKGELWGDGVSILGVDIETFKSQLLFKDNLLTCSPMVIKVAEDSMIDGYLTLNLLNGKMKNFKLNFQKLALVWLEHVLPIWFQGQGESGAISGSVAFDSKKGQDYWEFSVDGRQILLKEQEVDSFFVEGAFLGRQGEIRNLFIKTCGGNLSLSGQFSDKGKFSGTLEAEALQLDRMKFIADVLPEMKGEMNCQGEVDWSEETRNGNLTLFVRNLETRGRELGNFGGEMAIDDQGLRVTSGEFDKLGIKIDGKMDWAGRKAYKAELILDKADLSFLPEAHGIKTFDYGGLLVTGQCSMQGDLESRYPDVIDLKVEALRIQKENDVIVSNRPMQILYQNEGIEIRSLELKYRLGVLGIEGVISPGKTMAMMVNGKDFSLKAIGRLFDLPNWNYDGSLSVNARVYGNFGDLKLKAAANIDELMIAGRKIPAVSAKIEGDAAGIDIEEALVKLPNSSFNLKGNVKLAEGFQPDQIDLHLFVPSGPLADLPAYLPTVFREASGTIKADLNLSGRPMSPQITGELRLTADQLAFSNMRKPLTNVIFALSTNDRLINIDELTANLGRGKLAGHGTVDFRDNLGSITANISGEKLDLSFMNLEINGASATFDVRGDLYNPVVKGKVLVPRGKFNLSTDLLSKRKKFDLFFGSLDYSIDFEVPRNFWIKSNFLNAEMRGKFTMSGDLEKIRLDGGVSCVQGNLFFQQRKFRIDTGDIKFGGVDNSLDPYIYVKSEGQVQSTRIFLTLQGHISSFTPKIYSTPPMSEGDLLAMLTLGRDLNTAMHTDSKELFESEILDGLKNSYISALIGNTISTALNLDELFLSSLFDRSSGKSKSFIRVGKYIGQNIFMAYEGTMYENEEETYIFEYRLPKGFVVNLEFKEPTKEQRVGVRYDWKFW